MKSYPSMAESLDAELNRYDREYDQKNPKVRRAFIQVFPAHARAEIEDRIRETKERLAGIAAMKVVDMVSWDSPSREKAQNGAHWVPRRSRPQTPEGLHELANSVQASIKHYSGATMEEARLRQFIGDVFGTASTNKAIQRLSKDPAGALLKAVRDLVLQHWETDESFFESIPRPTPEHGTDMSFWEGFLEHGVLRLRLKMANAQPREVVELEPKLIEVLKRRGKEPQDFFEAGSSVQETWIAEARGERGGANQKLREMLNYAVKQIHAQGKAKKASSRGGKRPKTRAAIYAHVKIFMEGKPGATFKDVLDSIPRSRDEPLHITIDEKGQDVTYDIYCDGKTIIQTRQTLGGKAGKPQEVAVATLQRYMTLARNKNRPGS